MKKHVFFILVLAMVFAGNVFAQEVFTTDLGFGNAGMGFNSGFQFDLMADGEESSSGPVLTGVPFLAGLTNIPLGLWSWLNKDWVGGAITTGLYAIGITCWTVAGSGNLERGGQFYSALGFAGIIAAPIYGYRRGSRQARQMRSASVAETFGGNPLNNISLVVLTNI